MGSNLAHDLANSDISLEQQLIYHLRGNHYPPIPSSMVQPCIEAINAANAGNWHELIELPAPIRWRGESFAPANILVEAHHLEAWLDREDD